MSQIYNTTTGGAVGAVTSLTGDVGIAIVPVAGNIDLLGGTNITTTGTPGTITIDLVATIGVPLGGTGLTTITDHGVMVGSGVGAVTPLVVGTDGQVLVGDSADDPIFATLGSTLGTIQYDIGAGTLALDCQVAQALSGFASWDGAGPYFDDTVLGDFEVSESGVGYIQGQRVTWAAPQTETGMTAGNTYLIYIDDTGTIGKTTTYSTALFRDNIVLFECLRDSTAVTNLQVTVKENHPYTVPWETSSYLHDVIGTSLTAHENGANIILDGTQKIAISGADELEDHGLETDIPDSGGTGVTWHQYFTLGSGKWAQNSSTDTFVGEYNNAGTATALGGNKFGVYKLYVSKDNITVTTPTYFAVLHTAQFNNLASAQTAIADGTIAGISGELAALEMARLGYIIFAESSTTIVDVIIDKETIGSGGTIGGTNIASLVLTDVTNFDGILSAADTTVQAALETIDDMGDPITIAHGGTFANTMATTYGVNYFDGTRLVTTAVGTATHVLTSNGVGVAPTFQAAAGGGVASVTGGSNINTTGTGADPVVNLDNSPSVSGSVTAATGMSITTGDMAIVSGKLTMPTTTSADGQIQINSARVLHTYGTNNVFVGSGAGNFTLSSNSCVAVGYQALDALTSANECVALGYLALSACTEGSYNTAIGQSALSSVTTGTRNIGIGRNTAVNLLTGTRNITIGYTSASAYTGAESNNICIANAGVIADANTLRLGTQGTGSSQIDTTYIAGIYDTEPAGGHDNVVVIDSNGQLGGSVMTASTGVQIAVGTKTTTFSSTGTTLNDQTGTTYTLVIGDAGKYITFTNAAAIAVTIPTNASVAFPIGTQIGFMQGGAGQTTFAGAAPPTLRSADAALTTVKIYSVGYMLKIDTDEWVFGGDLEA